MTHAPYVEHVMVMPISLALRGRHADDDWPRSVGRRARRPPRRRSRLQYLSRGLVRLPPQPWRADRRGTVPPRSRGPRLANRPDWSPAVLSTYGRDAVGPDVRGEGLGVERCRTRSHNLPGTDYCLSAGGDMTCRVADPIAPAGGSGSKTRTTRTSWRQWSRSARARSPRPACIAGATTSRRAHRYDAGHAAPRSRRTPCLTQADIDATAAFALGADARAWLQSTPGSHRPIILRTARAISATAPAVLRRQHPAMTHGPGPSGPGHACSYLLKPAVRPLSSCRRRRHRG
jgi:thiamine biosynthesis lipoprotein